MTDVLFCSRNSEEEALATTFDILESIQWVGNILPYMWTHHIKTSEGRTHLAAIHLLSEIVYWYRPNRVYDEDTGEYVGYEKRFKGKCFCRFSGAFEAQLGLTQEGVKEGLDVLVSLGLISYEIGHGRTPDYASGLLYGIALHADAVARISQLTFGEENGLY